MDINQARQLRDRFLPSARMLIAGAGARRAADPRLRMLQKANDVLSMGIGSIPGTNAFTVAVRSTTDSDDLRNLLARLQEQSDVPVDLSIIKPPTLRAGRRMGDSIGHLQITAGTLGAFVVDNGSGKHGILSNNHVIADNNEGVRGDPIIHPGVSDHGTLAGRFATLERFVPLDGLGTNYVDAAFATLDASSVPASHPAGPRVSGRIVGAEPDLEVFKAGRTTQATFGVISAIELNGLAFDYSAQLSCSFDNQIEVRSSIFNPFSAGGDSGSLVMALNGDAVGLLFAGTTSADGKSDLTYINPIGAVLTALNLSLAPT